MSIMKDYVTAKERLSTPNRWQFIENICFASVLVGLGFYLFIELTN